MYHDDDVHGTGDVERALFVGCLIVFLMLLTCSCGPATDSRLSDAPREWDDRLRPYLKTFVHEMGTVRDSFRPLEHELPAVLQFAVLPEGIAGFCYYADAFGEVYIDISYENEPAALRLLVAHELAHCALRAGHDPVEGEIQSAHVPLNVHEWSQRRWTAAWDRLASVVP